MTFRLSEAQFKALSSAIEHGSATHHLQGPLAWAGWGVAREALQRRGYLDAACRITEEGRLAHAAHRGEAVQPRMV